MFNSLSTTTSKTEKTYLPVLLTLVGGETLKGAIAIRKNGNLGDLLNSSDKYVLFKSNAGEPIYLAQTTIAAVQSNEKPTAEQLDVSLDKFENSNPYHILNVKPGVDRDALRNSYHELVKHYHPDQFANTKLPKEVHAYLHSVIQRLNAAHQELVDEFDRQERLKQLRAAAQQVPNTGTIRYFGH